MNFREGESRRVSLASTDRECLGVDTTLLLSLALLLASIPIIPAGETLACIPTAIWDGDGPVWCAEGPRVRLAGIGAGEANGTSNSTQTCPDATAEHVRETLATLIVTPGGFNPHGSSLRQRPYHVLSIDWLGWWQQDCRLGRITRQRRREFRYRGIWLCPPVRPLRERPSLPEEPEQDRYCDHCGEHAELGLDPHNRRNSTRCSQDEEAHPVCAILRKRSLVVLSAG